MLVHTAAGLKFGGFHTSRCWQAISAPRAEATAISVALFWAIQLARAHDLRNVPFHFYFDSLFAGHAAQGLCHSDLNKDLTDVVRSLALWLEQIAHQPLRWTHVKGHSNDPWNDLADALAHHAIINDRYTFDASLCLATATFDTADFVTAQWLWLFELSLRGHPDAPVLCNRWWKFNVATPITAQPTADVVIHLRLATANVLTLYPAGSQSATFLGARAEDLAQQFSRSGINCIGIQESRCRRHGHDFFEGFHILSAEATARGHGGVQLWFSRFVRTPKEEIHFEHDHFRIIHGDDRRLIVRLRHPQLCLLLLVLHAPCDDDESVLHAWWKQTSSLIPSSFASWSWLVMTDANSRVGTVRSQAVGPEGAEHENLRGSLFHEWLLQHNLWLPQTFDSTHTGSHVTWKHPSQGQGRIDYIAISSDVSNSNVQSWVHDKIDLSLAREDHSCVCTDVWMPLRSADAREPPVALHADACNPRWHHDVHTHAALLQAQYRARVPPPSHGKMCKRHLTKETCVLIQRKKQARRRLKRSSHDMRLTFLRAIFQTWKRSPAPACPTPQTISALFRQCALDEEFYRQAARRVCTAVRRDDTQFYEDLAEETGRVADRGHHHIWDAIKPMLPKWRNRRKHNLRCTGPTVEQRIQHYCDLEAGVPLAYPALLDECHRDQLQRLHDVPLQLDLPHIPSRLELERRFQRLTVNRAPGPDQLTPNFVREHGPDLAADLFQLSLKMWLTGCEPVQWKGGWIHSISKKIHSHKVEHMRGILLMDVLGKVLHAVLRARFLPTMLTWRQPLQLGGFPACSTLFATQYLRTFQQRAVAMNLTSAVLFIDVKSAFHCMVRQLLFGPGPSLPAELDSLLRKAGCDPDAILREAATSSEAFHHDVPVCEQRLLHDAHCHTWFSVAGSGTTFETFRGSRPGSPLADIAFNAMMIPVLNHLRDALQSMPTLQQGFCALGLPAPPVTWVDDIAIPVIVQHCHQLEDVLTQVTCSTVSIFQQAGMILNFDTKKTEAVVAFRGPQAPAHRKDLFVERHGRMIMPDGTTILRCVGSYEHLGTIFTADGLLRSEVTHRRNRAIQAHRQVAKGIFRNRHIAVAARLKLFESLIVPIILHGAGNWGLLSPRSFNSLHACIIGWQRSIINDGFWTSDQHTDFSLQCTWRLPPLTLRLAKARLLYAFHAVREGPQLLIDYLTADQTKQGWFQALRNGLQWLSTLDGHFCSATLFQASPECIIEWLTLHADDGPRHVRRLFKKSLMQLHVLGDALDLHHQMKQTLQRGGVLFQDLPPQRRPTVDACFQCQWCVHHFDQPQKLQAHMWMAHQMISDERKFVFSGTCLACKMCFWSAARLQQHLRLSRRHAGGCFEQLTWRYAPLKTACAAAVPEDLRGFARLPAMPAIATSSSPIETMITSRQDAFHTLEQAWHAEALPEALRPHVHDDVFAFADSVVCDWRPRDVVDLDTVVYALSAYVADDDEKLWALFYWCRDALVFTRFSHLATGTFQQLKLAMHELLEQTPLGRLQAWRDRMNMATRSQDGEANQAHQVTRQTLEMWVDPVHFQMTGFEQFHIPFAFVPDCTKVPVNFENGHAVIWILHLFSGRRRRGDCHFWVECLHNFIPGYTVKILSVDTAVHKTMGNLDRGPVFSWLLRIVRKRFFASSLTGPPCETFSAARHWEVPDERHPRPLRSASTPWLLAERTCKELHQTLIGTRLLYHSLIVEVEMVLAGGGSLMEHPREHPVEERVSVWRLQLHRKWIMHLPDAMEHHVEQWQVGSPGVKPTTLRALDLGPPQVVFQVFRDGVDPLKVRPLNPLRGKASDGRYKTAAAKEYPSSLCRTLVIAILSGLKYRLEHSGWTQSQALSPEESEWITRMHQSACEATLSGTFLPDFQG